MSNFLLLFLFGSRHLSYSSRTMGDKMMELLGSKVEVLQNNSSIGEKRSVRGDDGRQTDETAGGRGGSAVEQSQLWHR